MTDVEVLRSEFDAYGYDLVIARASIVRHIQLKTGSSSKPRDVSISVALATKPSGCVLWISVSARLELGPFFWFGNAPNEPLSLIEDYASPRRATHNKAGERPLRKNHRLVPARDFRKLNDMNEVLEVLFGTLPTRLPQSDGLSSSHD